MSAGSINAEPVEGLAREPFDKPPPFGLSLVEALRDAFDKRRADGFL